MAGAALAAALPQIISIAAAVGPKMPGIIRSVEALFGRGNGAQKRQAAVALAKEVPDIVAAIPGGEGVDQTLGNIVDFTVGMLTSNPEDPLNNHHGGEVATQVPGKVGLPVAIQVAAQENADGSITLVVPAPELRKRPS